MRRLNKNYSATFIHIHAHENPGDVIYDYYRLSSEIKDLGSIVKWKEFGLARWIIYSAICFISMFTVFLSLQSILSRLSSLFCLLSVVSIVLCVLMLIILFRLLITDYYKDLMYKFQKRRSDVIEFMIRYYLVNKKPIKAKIAKKYSPSQVTKKLLQLNDTVVNNNCCKADIDYLIKNFDNDLKALEEKIKRNFIIVYAVTLTTTCFTALKDIISYILYSYFLYNGVEAEKALWSSIGNLAAAGAFLLILFFIQSMKGNYDSYLNEKLFNLRYASYILNKIQSQSKDIKK